jgi:hypothetical protein
MITLFTFKRKLWLMNPLEAIRKYGSFDKNGRKGLYFTLSQKPNSHGLYIYVNNNTVAVRHIDGTTIALWKLKDLEYQFNKKIPALILVYAQVEERDRVEFF